MAEPPIGRSSPLLDVEIATAGYGTATVLDSVSFSAGVESLGIVGRNGMGKSTLCKVICGLHRNASGSVRLQGKEILGRRPAQIGRSGIGYVPQGRRIFASLTVTEHFQMLGPHRSKDWPIDRVFDLFPRLGDRRSHLGRHLSGGEQQMLAIARAVVRGPRLLIMDEPSEGLAPVVVDTLVDACLSLAADGHMGILVVEQNLHAALRLTGRILVMVRGAIVEDMPTEEFRNRTDLQELHLGVSRSDVLERPRQDSNLRPWT
ncbi:MAG: ABC transporter ATP-binding protein [Acidimicrobiia bacterium]|nr:ABC transporter ATP-binding protein [Acidimicrobiia bacterium]